MQNISRILPASRQNFFRLEPVRPKKYFQSGPYTQKKYFHHAKTPPKTPDPTSLNIPLIPGDCSPPMILLRRRNTGAGIRKNSAVETMPTPGKISHQNRHFLKIPVLIGKKPAFLAARQNAQKKDTFSSMAGDCPCWMTAIARKKRGFLQG